jgi:hypothetical protein
LGLIVPSLLFFLLLLLLLLFLTGLLVVLVAASFFLKTAGAGPVVDIIVKSFLGAVFGETTT